MALAKCEECGASIQWQRTPAGAKMPIDLRPHEDGNVSLETGLAVVLTHEGLEDCKRRGVRRFRPHFATCPKRKS